MDEISRGITCEAALIFILRLIYGTYNSYFTKSIGSIGDCLVFYSQYKRQTVTINQAAIQLSWLLPIFFIGMLE